MLLEDAPRISPGRARRVSNLIRRSEQPLENSTPILIGCGDVTDLTTPIETGRSPMDLIAQAGRRALADAGVAELGQAIDTLAVPRLFSDSLSRFQSRFGGSTNPPLSIARRLGLTPRRLVYTTSGGNMPQALVNQFAEEIAGGEMRAAIILGGELLRTQLGIERAGLEISWHEDPGGTPESIGIDRRGCGDEELRHQMRSPIAAYSLIENAVRAARKHTVADHLQAMGRLFARFAAVAAANPLATRRAGYSAERLAAIDDENRWIGFPYPRLMVANAYVDQAAAVIMTSVGEARRLDIAPEKWVFLHGCADTHDQWFISERPSLERSLAIRLGAKAALDMAGRTLGEIDFFDIYSCFPSAVEVACRELGLAEDDPRGLTVTGGLPYFGGPGSSYSIGAISEMMRQLRRTPNAFGLITANGNYLTKQSFGIYSTTPYRGRWQRENPSRLQAEIDALPRVSVVTDPHGPATIETYMVMHGTSGPEYAIVFGRLNGTNERFIANTPGDRDLLWDLQNREGLGRRGIVRPEENRNLFVPEP
jgi:acetyl-CoA C-acetyltransferase